MESLVRFILPHLTPNKMLLPLCLFAENLQYLCLCVQFQIKVIGEGVCVKVCIPCSIRDCWPDCGEAAFCQDHDVEDGQRSLTALVD